MELREVAIPDQSPSLGNKTHIPDEDRIESAKKRRTHEKFKILEMDVEGYKTSNKMKFVRHVQLEMKKTIWRKSTDHCYSQFNDTDPVPEMEEAGCDTASKCPIIYTLALGRDGTHCHRVTSFQMMWFFSR